MERVEGLTVRRAAFRDLAPSALYGLLRLRSEVFVVEQQCVYLDLDGRDADDRALHMWAEDASGAVLACLRVLHSDGGGSELGRVVTAVDHRRKGIAGRLVEEAVAVAPRPVRINAQSYLERWYERFGFARCGDEFVEDGIPHVPMELV